MIEVAGKQPIVEPVRVAPDYGKFIVEPLPHGFGVTLGNALRRALLSSVPGVAIATARIDGQDHEFTTIEGMREDLTELILNLKAVALQVVQPNLVALDAPHRWQGRIEAEGRGEVTAADVDVPPEIEVVNPELHLATLTSDTARLRVELEIETGVGYLPPISGTSASAVWASFRSTAFTRPCSASITRSRAPGSGIRRTSTGWSWRSGPMAP